MSPRDAALRPFVPALVPLLVLSILGLAFVGCAPRRLASRHDPAAARVGVYRGRVSETEGRSRRFRLLLFAEMPDRLHAEIVSPLGSTELIIDGNDALLAVLVPKERLAFVGTGGAEAMRRLVGVALTVGDLVEGLLEGGGGGEGYRLRRRGGDSPGLPGSFRLEGGGKLLELRLKRRSPLRAAADDLGAARVPPSFEVRALESLEWEWFEPGPVDTP